MFEEYLIQWGMAGIFICYLIYDKQVLMKEIVDNIKMNTEVTMRLSQKMEEKI